MLVKDVMVLPFFTNLSEYRQQLFVQVLNALYEKGFDLKYSMIPHKIFKFCVEEGLDLDCCGMYMDYIHAIMEPDHACVVRAIGFDTDDMYFGDWNVTHENVWHRHSEISLHEGEILEYPINLKLKVCMLCEEKVPGEIQFVNKLFKL